MRATELGSERPLIAARAREGERLPERAGKGKTKSARGIAPESELEAFGHQRRFDFMKPHRLAIPSQDICLDNLLTTEQVAADLKVATKTVRALCAARAINALRICGRWRIPATALDEFKRSHLSPRV